MKSAVHGAVTRRVTRRVKPRTAVPRASTIAPAWTTPALLRLGLYATFFATLLLLIAVLTSAFLAREALMQVGRQAAPGILAADRIEGMLADMDASAIAELSSRNADPRTFDLHRQQVADAIIGAAENVSYRDLEQAPLQKLGIELGSYTGQIQQARDAWKSGDKRYRDAYRRAASIMNTELIPASERLDRNMSDLLESSYTRYRRISKAISAFLVWSAFLTGSILLVLQWFLATRTRRLINPLLFGATVVLVAFSGYSAQAFDRESYQFRLAKESIFDKAHSRLQASAQVQTSALDASRYKLDPDYFRFSNVPFIQMPPIDDAAFDQAIDSAFRDISGFEISAPTAILVILLCTFMGVLPRLREYSV